MKNTENSWKTRILSSFLFAVFTQAVPDGGNYPCTIAKLMFDRLKKKWHSTLLHNIVKKTISDKNPFFEN